MEKRFTRDREQKIQSIYEAFQELVNKAGYDSLTTRKVAKKAKISVGPSTIISPKGKHQ